MIKLDHLTTITAGFLPLTDSMMLVVAKEKGFAQEQGIDLRLSRQLSWASIRDHIAVGQFDVAHMLAPMPIAFNTGLAPIFEPVMAPMALGLGGNAITVSTSLWDDLLVEGAVATANAKVNGEALCRYIKRPGTGRKPPIRFGVVHAHSGHNLELRYWLASCGINPEEDIEIVIVPPPLMPAALASGQIHGYCVGEPWNSVSVENGVGCILTTKSDIWRSSPEKVLGVRCAWAEENPEVLFNLLHAMYRSAQWCAEPSNRNELAGILADPEYIGVSASVLVKALDGRIDLNKTQSLEVPDFLIPFDRAATFPWQSHALWFFSQMVRWGLVEYSEENLELAKQSYRPDLYRRAFENSELAVPSANMKVEGALKVETAVGSSGRLSLGPDGFFDGKVFDPDQVKDYLQSF